MEYKASLDSNAILTTIGTGVVLLLVAYICIRLVFKAHNESKGRFAGILFFYGFIFVAVVLITVKSYLSMPESYILKDNELSIHRPFSDIHIPLNDIEKVWLVDSAENVAIKRVSGDNGFLGYFGRYAYPKAGEMHAYATRKNNWIIMVTKNNGTIAISPDDIGLYDGLMKKIIRK